MSKSHNIAVIPGDGTGPEVIAEAIKVANVAAEKFDFTLNMTEFDIGADRYLRTGETLPDSVLEELRGFDAILFGAIGRPDVKPGVLEQGLLLKMRFEMDQYINLRPVKLYPGVETPVKGKGVDEINFVVVRENTEGLYASTGGHLKKGTDDEVAIQTSINTAKGVNRCLKYAFEYTQKRKRKELTLCGKTNVLTYAWDLWERNFNEMGDRDFSDIKRDYQHVDAICMYMIMNPEYFDVIVTDNMFGDIITDLGASIQGGLGIAAGGNINPEGVSMFEPIGGSAPKFTGTGGINPLAAICAAGMMFDVALDEPQASKAIEQVVMDVTANKMKSMEAMQMGHTTTEVGDLVAQGLADL